MKSVTATRKVKGKRGPTLTPFEDVKRELMKDREFRLEYDRLRFRQEAGRVLQTARTRAGLTQEEVAVRAHTKQSVIARLENGRGGFPSFELLDRISRVLGMKLSLSFEPSRAA